MPLKKKKGKGGKKKGKTGKKKTAAQTDLLAPDRVPTPPRPMERLAKLLTTHEVDERELFGMKLSSRALDMLSPQEIKDLRLVFEAFDMHGKGMLGAVEIRRALRTLGFRVNKDQARRMVQDASLQNHSSVDFNEFLDIIIDQQGDSKDIYDELVQGFRLFDVEGEGHLNLESLKQVCQQTDTKLSKVELQDMMLEADLNGDGLVDREEFIKIMLQTNLF